MAVFPDHLQQDLSIVQLRGGLGCGSSFCPRYLQEIDRTISSMESSCPDTALEQETMVRRASCMNTWFVE